MKMTNKQYKEAREAAENASELYTFETFHPNYFGGYYSKYMQPDDIKELRQEYRQDKKENKAFSLDEFGSRAVIIPTESGAILKSYYTEVAEIRNGEFIKLWNGYSNTTLKHINAFRNYYGMRTISKREFIEMEGA